METTIKRINELAALAKTRTLTKEETEEREKLRKIYMENFRKNFKNKMNNIYIKEKDGSITKLTGE